MGTVKRRGARPASNPSVGQGVDDLRAVDDEDAVALQFREERPNFCVVELRLKQRGDTGA